MVITIIVITHNNKYCYCCCYCDISLGYCCWLFLLCYMLLLLPLLLFVVFCALSVVGCHVAVGCLLLCCHLAAPCKVPAQSSEILAEGTAVVFAATGPRLLTPDAGYPWQVGRRIYASLALGLRTGL